MTPVTYKKYKLFMTTVKEIKDKYTILVQGDKPNEWFPASDNQIKLLIKSGLTYIALHGEGYFEQVTDSFAAAEGKDIFNYTLYPAHDRYCRLFYLRNDNTKKTRMIVITELPKHDGATEMNPNNIKKSRTILPFSLP